MHMCMLACVYVCIYTHTQHRRKHSRARAYTHTHTHTQLAYVASKITAESEHFEAVRGNLAKVCRCIMCVPCVGVRLCVLLLLLGTAVIHTHTLSILKLFVAHTLRCIYVYLVQVYFSVCTTLSILKLFVAHTLSLSLTHTHSLSHTHTHRPRHHHQKRHS